jgi:tetratricopeptide (TPR) repeat protein
MTPSTSSAAASQPRDNAEALAARLVAEMIQRWRRGDRVYPEQYLLAHPELWQHPEAAADLIYEELCLRQEYGPVVPPEQVLGRFPQWRQQLEVLFDCQRVLGPRRTRMQFPAAGEALGDFLLLAELGRGAHGRVFLASQVSLGDRPVVLKVTPLEAYEHLALARLQHTHIVPLYSAQDDPQRGLRSLCMPYFGGATLAQLLEVLRARSPATRTGQDLVDALERAQSVSPLATPVRGPTRQALAAASYEEAICWIGAGLADALHYAHERGLVHLDVKPSNVLIAADGQPMLLDFHLAREFAGSDTQRSAWLGGTPGYMSPEQEAALRAAEEGKLSAAPVDGRSDQYSLALVLHEALAGTLPAGTAARQAVAGCSVALSDLIDRCLATRPEQRYPDMAAVAADLRRHLAHRPLAGVRNRSLAERWRKWRRRRPQGLTLVGMMLVVMVAAGALALAALSHLGHRIDTVRNDLAEARRQMDSGHWDDALRALERGLSTARALPMQGELEAELLQQWRRACEGLAGAESAEAARALHRVADRFRVLLGADRIGAETLQGLEAACRSFWERRAQTIALLGQGSAARLEPEVRHDLLDLAIFWADLQPRLVAPADEAAAQQRALAILNDADALFGPSRVLDAERMYHGGPAPALAAPPVDSAWEHYALGRALLRAGDLERAAAETQHAVRLAPHGLWSNFYHGVCAYRRGLPAEAVTAFSVCIGAAPDAAGCYYNRALAYEALGQKSHAARDYAEAVRLDPSLAGMR